MNLDEMLRIQGIIPQTIKHVVSDQRLGAMIGNAMSQNVVERLLIQTLPAAKLWPELKDRWWNLTSTERVEDSIKPHSPELKIPPT